MARRSSAKRAIVGLAVVLAVLWHGSLRSFPVASLPRLPIGTANFARLREDKCQYVDKTIWLPKLVESGKQHFLSRPRRWGKSLLLDTVKCVFMPNGEEKTQLFKDLAISKSGEGRQLLQMELPVVRLGLSRAVSTRGAGLLIKAINRLLISEAARNGVKGVEATEGDVQGTLSNVIGALREKHEGKRVVWLVDECDHPITSVLAANGGEMDRRLIENLEVLGSLYTECKELAGDSLHYSLYMGVTRFARTSLFSGANQLEDLSLDPRWSSLIGFTWKEVESTFRLHLQALQTALGCNDTALQQKLETRYGGHSFGATEKLLNPWSLLNALSQQELGASWMASTPRWLYRALRTETLTSVVSELAKWHDKSRFQKFEPVSFAAAGVFDALNILQQTGYLTVVETQLSDDDEPQVKLDFPNTEIRKGFWPDVSRQLFSFDSTQQRPRLKEAFLADNLTKFMDIVNQSITGTPYTLFPKTNKKSTPLERLECFYHVAYFLTPLKPEEDGDFVVCTDYPDSQGRRDVSYQCRSKKQEWIIELKVEKTARIEEALSDAVKQVRKYAPTFIDAGQTLTRVAVAVDWERRHVGNWSKA